jgi:(R,R)-butanediol dehydrogenase/meso-butanediol dehydrogenase/diacetyl reductase
MQRVATFTLCATGLWFALRGTGVDDDFVVEPSATRDMYDTTGWVTSIPIDDVIDEGFEALHEGNKMKALVDPSS